MDSLSRLNSPAAYFAVLYLETTVHAVYRFSAASPDEKAFMEKFEIAFAGLFFSAVQASDSTMPAVWKNYFSPSVKHPVKRLLLGINAHVNGDLWQALALNFSAAALKQYRPAFLQFQKELTKLYRTYYVGTVRSFQKLKIADAVSGGLFRKTGLILFANWRKQQYRLALLYHLNPVRFRKKLARISRRKERRDQFIMHHL